MSVSFYRKYRPQIVADLDLDQVREFFETILKSGKVSHAYLFTGPKGAGKTSAARILAKIVNCVHNLPNAKGAKPDADEKKKSVEHSALNIQPLYEPCNQCEECVSITNGSNIDLMEIDAASNRGIDDIRDLREKIRLAPVKSAYKVYIIDEVHMLTSEAFNALLKTLEEPPAHALFVLATTEAHKVPETILSRCVQVHFSQASIVEIVRSLKRVVEGEKLEVEKGALEAIAQVADGSFREAVKRLELLALSGEKITLDFTLKTFNQSGDMSPVGLLKALMKGNQREAFEKVRVLETHGLDWGVYVKEAIETLRELLLKDLGAETEGRRIGSFKEPVSREMVGELIKGFLRVAKEIREAPIPVLPIELLVAEWCSPREQNSVQRSAFSVQQPTVSEPTTDSRQLKAEQPRTDNREQVTENRKLKTGKPVVAFDEIQKRWKEVLLAVRPKNHSLEGLLRSTKPIEVVGNTLGIEVFYQFHLDQLKQERFLVMVEEVLAQLFSAKLVLEYRLGTKPARRVPTDVENISGDVADHDIVKAAEEIFGAE